MNAMRILTAVAIPLAASGISAQEAPLVRFTHEERQVSEAAFRWYMGFDPTLRDAAKTVVISNVSTGGNPRLKRDPADLEASERVSIKRVDLPRTAMSSLRAAAHGPVATCDSFDIATNDLCGVAGPWVWLVLSNVDIQGDRATVILQARWLELGAGNQLNQRPWRHVAGHQLMLERDGGRWRVVSFEMTAVS
ncbi:MAG: hypothetical protein AMXMBFR53_36830 [Gemmatimonadota bacterium]